MLPDTYIQSYNLSMTDRKPGIGPESAFWSMGNFLHSVLSNCCANNGITNIFDLLTGPYRMAIGMNRTIPGVIILQPVPNGPRGVLHLNGQWLNAYLLESIHIRHNQCLN